MDIFFERIAPLIIEARANGVKDADMERVIGLPPHSINKWFTGKYKSYKNYFPQIAAYFGVTVAYLLGEESKNPAPMDGNGIEDRISRLSLNFQKNLVLFLELAKENPDTAERFLAFAVQELQSEKQAP